MGIYTLLIGILIALAMSYIYILALPMLDEDYKSKIVPSDIMIISVSIVIIETLMYIAWRGNTCYYDLSALNGTMIFMAYTDQRTKQVYVLPSLILIALGLVRTVCACCISTTEVLILVISLLILFILSVSGMLGMGDWLIFLAIAIMYSYIKSFPIISFLICVFLSAILSVPYTIYRAIKKKDIKEHFPFTVYITIAVVVESVFTI